MGNTSAMRALDHAVTGMVPARWPLTSGVALAAGVAGLLLLPAVVPVARQLDVDPGLVEYTALPLVWNVLALVLLIRVVARAEGEPFRHLVARWWRLRKPADNVERDRHRGSRAAAPTSTQCRVR